MKKEITQLNDSMEEVGRAINSTAHVPADIYMALIPIASGAVTMMWMGSRMGTEALAGGVDTISDKAQEQV